MSDPQLQNTVSGLESQMTDSQQKFEISSNEQLLRNLIQDYARYHDLCFGKAASPQDDARWESLFTSEGVSELHPLGVHHGREGKMAWAQVAFGGRGQGCQILMSNVRIVLEKADSTFAVAQSNADLTAVPDDSANTFTMKGQYDWEFHKLDGIWKVAHVKLSPVPNL